MIILHVIEKRHFRSRRTSCQIFLMNLYNFQFKLIVRRLFVDIETQFQLKLK